MHKMLLTFLSLIFISVGAANAQAEIETYEIETPHTQIMFGVSHLGFSTSYGKFTDYSGNISFDREAPANSSVEITIQTNSLTMNHEKWDAHLHNEDFFNVSAFPEMTFKSTAINVTGENTADITGNLTLLGVTKPVTLKASFNKADKHPFSGKYVAGFSAMGILKRSEFGMNYGLPMIGDEVKLMIEIEAIRQ